MLILVGFVDIWGDMGIFGVEVWKVEILLGFLDFWKYFLFFILFNFLVGV